MTIARILAPKIPTLAFASLLAFAAALVLTAPAFAQGKFPSKPVTLQ